MENKNVLCGLPYIISFYLDKFLERIRSLKRNSMYVVIDFFSRTLQLYM